MVSEETVFSWSYGEVFNCISFDKITNKPTVGGLFCPRIFGPLRPYECLCTRPVINSLLYCDTCGVDFNINSILARSRFGHIQLVVPVVHVWFYKSVLNIISILLDVPLSIINDIINCNLHIIVETPSSKFKVDQFISSEVYEKLWVNRDLYKVLSGGEAISRLLSKICLKSLKFLLESKRKSVKSLNILNKLNNKIKIIDELIDNNIVLSNFLIKVLPVLPAVLRQNLVPDNNNSSDDFNNEKVPIFSDINKLYSNIININNNILFNFNRHIVSFEEYISSLIDLQQAVDMLIDNSSGNDNPTYYNTTALKSLSETLKGKTGRFRNTLLGKRVDYSGRSVIVPGPELLLCECAIPRIMALELFKPFIYFKAMLKYKNIEIEFIKFFLMSNPNLEIELLEEVVKYCPVILNRAPSLHKLSIRAFWVKLTNEKAIRLHPLTCSGFNADFDGDQMAVHVPLSLEARLEAIVLIMSVENVLHPAHGGLCIFPTQDMIIGLYYMSLISLDYKDICFTSYIEVDSALLSGIVNLHTKVKFIILKNNNYITITSTPGRLLIMSIVPIECDFIYEWTYPDFDRNYIYNTIDLVLSICGRFKMISFCEALMVLGFKYASQSGISLSRFDLIQSKYKFLLVKKVRSIVAGFSTSFLRNNARLQGIWSRVLDNVYNIINLDVLHCDITQKSIQIMFNSGARGSLLQIKHLIGSKGYVIGFNGKSCGMPILNSYFDGLNLIQFFCCTYVSRKGLIDMVLKTPVSGYLTRKLVEISRECIISEEDCNIKTGLYIRIVLNLNFIKDRLMGRFLAKPIIYNNRIMIKFNTLITEYNICDILRYCNGFVYIRSPVTCQSKVGVCKFCYGVNLSLAVPVRLGDSIGTLAAQAIAEPGTQFTLKTFHGLNYIKYGQYDYEGLENVLRAPFSGVVSLIGFSCVCTSSGSIIIVSTNAVLSILNDNIIVWKQKLCRGVSLLVLNNVYINMGEILCFNFLLNKNYFSLVGGIVFFKDLIYNLNFRNVINNQIRLLKYSISKYYFCEYNQPLLCLRVNFIVLYYFINKDIDLLVSSGIRVNVFDILLVLLIRKGNIVQLSSFGGFSKLSKLFECGEKDNCLVVSSVKGILRYGSLDNNSGVYVIDPISVALKPIVYFVHNGKCLLGNNERLDCGQTLISGEIGFLNFIGVYEVNDLFNCFINMALEIYEFQGVSMNSKHIEVVLRRMTSIVSIFNRGDTFYTYNRKHKFQDLLLVNYYIRSICGNLVLFSRNIMGITNLCADQTSILSSISFHGSVKSIVNAILIGGICTLKGIKDSIILGNLPLVGTVNKISIIKEIKALSSLGLKRPRCSLILFLRLLKHKLINWKQITWKLSLRC